MQATQEQHDIVVAVNTGENLLVSALAGTGKTTTLRLIAETYPDRKMLYLAYNKNMQLDALKIGVEYRIKKCFDAFLMRKFIFIIFKHLIRIK